MSRPAQPVLRTVRRFGTLAVAAVALLSSTFALAAPAAADTSDTVRITVDSISPATPARTASTRPITFGLTVTNNGTADLSSIVVTAQRGYPVTTQQALGPVKLAPTTPSNGDPAIAAMSPVTTSLAAGASTQVTFATTTGINQGAKLCLCANAVYPVYFTATVKSGGKQTVVGHGGTYLPVSYSSVHKLQVGWLWPLIDRPHRLFSDTVFEDDDLAGEVSSGGRLDRALAVVEQVGSTVPVTLVIDPETIDELAVMAAGAYRVRSGQTTTTAGAGTTAAGAWLDRLHTVLTTDDDVSVELTPYADPDVQALSSRGHTWTASMPQAMAARVDHALAGATVAHDLAWPASDRIDSRTLSSLIDQGAHTVVLSSSGLSTGLPDTSVAPGAVTVRDGRHSVPVLVTTSRLTGLVDDAVTQASPGVAVLPRLLAELSIRVTEDPTATHGVLLVPPRYVDPDVDAASTTIQETTSSVYTTGTATSDLTSAVDGNPVTATLRSGAPRGGLPPLTYDALRVLHTSSSTIRSLLVEPADSQVSTPATVTSLLASIPEAAQRLTSAAFRSSGGQSPSTGTSYAVQLSGLIDQLRNAVHIVPPSSGTYTLASGHSAIPVTVVNPLSYAAHVIVRVTTIGGVPGLSTDNTVIHRIPAQSKVILHVPASVLRSGRLRVQAELTSPDGSPLGSSITLSINSTALGRIGIIIMVVAGALLVVALARRWVLSAARRRNPSPVVNTSGNET